MVKIAMTIAGSDSGGGAGIQADLKTFQELGTFGTSAITAITAQNTLGVHGVQPIDLDMIESQIDAVMTDLRPDAVKTGMLFSAEIIRIVAEKFQQYNIQNIVIDPVMIAKGGASLLQQEAVDALKNELVPLATIITPNIPEAEVLADMEIVTEDHIAEAAKRILALGAKGVWMKGGHSKDPEFAKDFVFLQDGTSFSMTSKRIDTDNTHGTGCTSSASVTASLAKGMSLKDALIVGKSFIQAAIEEDLQLGSGHGPTNHSAYRYVQDRMEKEIHVE